MSAHDPRWVVELCRREWLVDSYDDDGIKTTADGEVADRFASRRGARDALAWARDEAPGRYPDAQLCEVSVTFEADHALVGRCLAKFDTTDIEHDGDLERAIEIALRRIDRLELAAAELARRAEWNKKVMG